MCFFIQRNNIYFVKNLSLRNPFIFATQCGRPWAFQIIKSVRYLILKYQYSVAKD